MKIRIPTAKIEIDDDDEPLIIGIDDVDIIEFVDDDDDETNAINMVYNVGNWEWILSRYPHFTATENPHHAHNNFIWRITSNAS